MTIRLFCLIKNGNNSNSHSGVTALKFHKWQPKKTLSPAHIYMLSIKYSIQWHSILTTLCKRVYISTLCLFKYSICLLEKKNIYIKTTLLYFAGECCQTSNKRDDGHWLIIYVSCCRRSSKAQLVLEWQKKASLPIPGPRRQSDWKSNAGINSIVTLVT